MTDGREAGSVFPDSIDLYPPSSELDALLAECVLGVKVRRYKEWTGYENWLVTTPDGEELYILLSPHSVYGAAPFWTPSTDRSDAQVLVEHLYRHSEYRTLTEEVTGENSYCATLSAQRPANEEAAGAPPGDATQDSESSSVTGIGPTPALAVCRAVYKAAYSMRGRRTTDDNRE